MKNATAQIANRDNTIAFAAGVAVFAVLINFAFGAEVAFLVTGVLLAVKAS